MRKYQNILGKSVEMCDFYSRMGTKFKEIKRSLLWR